jgi:hypothetical protein
MSTKKKQVMIAPQSSTSVQDFIRGKTNVAAEEKAPLPPTAPEQPTPQAPEQQPPSTAAEAPSSRPVGRPKASTSKEQRTIHLPSDLAKRAEHYRVDHRFTMSALVELALKEYLDRHE